jgi:hypothetical protein
MSGRRLEIIRPAEQRAQAGQSLALLGVAVPVGSGRRQRLVPDLAGLVVVAALNKDRAEDVQRLHPVRPGAG